MSELEPVLPFWYQVDMIYELGASVAWRSFDRIWRGPDGKPFQKDGGAAATSGLASVGLPEEGRVLDPESLYNSTLGASTQTVAGPFSYPCSTVRVLPLLAKREVLEKFLDEYLNDAIEPTGRRFELWCSEESEHAYVYMTVWCYGDTASGTDNIGSWAKDDLSFMVPVRYYENGELRSLGLVPVYTLVDDTTSPIADTEVLGWPTNKGTFVQPANVWLMDAGAEAHQPLLRIAAQVFPSIAQGQEAVERVVLEIDQGEMVDEKNAQILADAWALLLRDEVERKKRCVAAVVGSEERGTNLQRARALALELLANERPVNVFTMKQFRDVHDPTRAAYQSVVRIQRTIKHLFELREIEEPLHLRIQEYPSLPMIRLLGLVATLASDQQGGVTYLLRPVRPFWMKMAWEEGLGQRMMYRCASEEWLGPRGEGVAAVLRGRGRAPRSTCR